MDLRKISAGSDVPKEINVIIEIPQGSLVKYEFDKEGGILKVDRFSHSAMAYPFNYGFMPNTKAGDGDPVDVLVMASLPVQAGALMAVRPVGLLETEDEAGKDNKVLAVPIEKVDPFLAAIKDVSDVPEATKAKIKHFYDHYKELEPGKWVKTGQFLSKEAAYKEIEKALK